MNMGKIDIRTSGIGVTTLFVVLIVLCLTIFSVLAFASSSADLRLSSKNAEMAEKYYGADNLAVRISADVTSLWQEDAPRPDAAALLRLEEAIIGNPGVMHASAADNGEDGIYVSYSIFVDILLTLAVELRIPESGVCEVQSWSLVAEEPETIESTESNLWQGFGQ
ncbi:MAG: hypothetical protein LBH39_07340 [Clostridiales Family XIII bacterium]|jgi:uncharacterized membrane protein affecting hemolysin expression|nr:hypothetical protein [Clostridiales Family XIII bacterium]